MITFIFNIIKIFAWSTHDEVADSKIELDSKLVKITGDAATVKKIIKLILAHSEKEIEI